MILPENKHNFYHKIIINLISSFPEFKSMLQSEFPSIYADIESASSNPNCSCVRKIESELLQNQSKSIIVLNKFLYNKDNNEKIKEIINIDYESMAPKSYQGKMFIIENTPESFKNLVDSVVENRGFFRSFSTSIDENGKLNIYFI
jgi:hypothetical protein